MKLIIPQALSGNKGRIRLLGQDDRRVGSLVATLKDDQQVLEVEIFTLPGKSQLKFHPLCFDLKNCDIAIPFRYIELLSGYHIPWS